MTNGLAKMPIPSGSSLVEEQIKLALINSLSMNEQLRTQSLEFLTTQCEPNPELQLALLNIIANNYTLPGPPPASTTDPTQQQHLLQYQAIMFMKNSLNRLFQANRNKKLFKSTQAGTQMQFTDQLRD